MAHTAQPPKRSPLEAPGFWSVLSLSFLDGIVALGARRPLEVEDMHELPDRLKSASIAQQFQPYWEHEQRSSARPSFTKALARAYWRRFLVASACVFGYALFCIAQPFFMGAILKYVQGDKDASFLGVSTGVGLAVALSLCTLLGSVVFNAGFYHMTLYAYFNRMTIMGCVFDKSLRLSSTSRGQYQTGAIVTMMSVDAERVWQACLMLNWLWLAPLLMGFALSMLVVEFGWAGAAGVAVALMAATYQYYAAQIVGNARKRLVKFTDERIKLTNEVLQGIRVLKVYNWEDALADSIEGARQREVEMLRRFHMTKMSTVAILFMTTAIVAYVIFSIYSALGHDLTISKVFSGLVLLNLIRLPITTLPLAISAISEAVVSLQRLDKFMSLSDVQALEWVDKNNNVLEQLHAPVLADQSADDDRRASHVEIELTAKAVTVPPNTAIFIRDATFSWTVDQQEDAVGFKLSHINLAIPHGQLVAIVGAVGQGKSSLLHAILGHMHRIDGYQRLQGHIAYVGQHPWIRNLTVRDNILFDEPYDEQRYTSVLEAAQLRQDLAQLPDGDATEIGERGINLSGGQKTRVAIARALYSMGTNIVIMDDPLSAVDVHVGKHLFEGAITKALSGKTRLVVLSSNYHLLPFFDTVIVMKEGKVAAAGPFSEIRETHPEYVSFQTAEGAEYESGSETPDGDAADDDEHEEVVEMPPAARGTIAQFAAANNKAGLTTAEDRVKGALQAKTYADYYGAALATTGDDENSSNDGVKVLVLVLILFAVAQVGRVLCDYWLGFWSDVEEARHDDKYLDDDALAAATPHSQQRDSTFFIWVYSLITWVTTLLVAARSYGFMTLAVRASANLHRMLIKRVLRAPINTYFDVTPTGRILNRFSKDLDHVDSLLPDSYLNLLQNAFYLVSVIILCMMTTWIAIPLFVPIFAVFLIIQKYFRKSSREIKRLEGVTRSPVYSLFSEVLQGVTTIRAYARKSHFVNLHHATADFNGRFFLVFWLLARWVALRLDCTATLVVLLVSLLAVLLSDANNGMDPMMLGLALTYALQLSGMLQWTVRLTIETENNMTSVERLLDFKDLPQEADTIVEDYRPPEQWPAEGRIEIRNLQMRYRPELDLVLKGVNLSIPGGTKVGVCGRTGAGKSSLMTALFRTVEPLPGSEIIIDDIDILRIGLSDLRANLTIIPQDPVLFSGSLRYNLDPFGRYSDAAVWEALQRVHMYDEVMANFPDKLEHPVAERGGNLSVGQRQLLCIARALLRASKVIIMDEATSSVDSTTDAMIQKTIRSNFNGCTILTIAHRLETIADYDMIVVMSAGRVEECGSPKELLRDADPNGDNDTAFAQLVAELGPERAKVFIEGVHSSE